MFARSWPLDSSRIVFDVLAFNDTVVASGNPIYGEFERSLQIAT
jgi:hypothetical protein